LKFGALFTGIGGFDKGLENVGMECSWQCEIDKNCLNILNRHWPNIPKFTDITKLARRVYDCEPETNDELVLCPICDMEFGDCECVGTDQLIDEYGEVDLLCGGFPCQSISAAKDRWGAKGLEGKESSLWFEYLRIIKEIYPKWIIIENVGRLRNGRDGKDFRTIVEQLDGLDYVGVGMVLDSASFGLPARRPRTFIVARKRQTDSGFSEAQRMAGHFLRNDPGFFLLQERGQSFSEDYGASRPSSSNYRMLTPVECSRLMGYPDDWNDGQSRTTRYKQLGNAVAIPVIEWIGKQILEIEEENEN